MIRLAKGITYRTLQSMASTHMLDWAGCCAQTPRTYTTTQDRERNSAQVVAHMGSLRVQDNLGDKITEILRNPWDLVLWVRLLVWSYPPPAIPNHTSRQTRAPGPRGRTFIFKNKGLSSVCLACGCWRSRFSARRHYQHKVLRQKLRGMTVSLHSWH